MKDICSEGQDFCGKRAAFQEVLVVVMVKLQTMLPLALRPLSCYSSTGPSRTVHFISQCALGSLKEEKKKAAALSAISF